MDRFIEHYRGELYDLIVIGGGITGAAVAYEAASQGFSVALVEKGDFGAATSAATSKLIHGGMRYLANYEFGLVRESLRERKTLENIAPNFVYPVPFLVPLYSRGPRVKWLIKTGMILYDLLSYDKAFTWDGSKKIPLHRSLSPQQVLDQEPVVDPDGLTGAILYYDCTNLVPERLTLAFIKSAVKHGAVVSNYAQVENFIRQAGKVRGVVVRDLLRQKIHSLGAKLVINCGGPWADLLLAIAGGNREDKQIRRSEGIHLVTPLLTQHYSVGGLTPSGRACNLIRWRGHTLIGTTDHEYIGDPDQYRVTREKIEEYITEVNGAFGGKDLVKYSDVLFAYGGLRPLVDDQTESTYKTSRKYEIYDNQKDGLPGMITVEGGKYTTSRNLAENVLKTVHEKLGTGRRKSITTRSFLSGCEIIDMDAFVSQAKSTYREYPETTVDYLARLYGTELEAVMQLARSNRRLAEPYNPDGEMGAQVLHAVRQEMARSLTDILLRRTGIATLGSPGIPILEEVATLAAVELNWSLARVDCELEAAVQALSVP
jgi:glycerol-3-phosphate dehydrogenase